MFIIALNCLYIARITGFLMRDDGTYLTLHNILCKFHGIISNCVKKSVRWRHDGMSYDRCDLALKKKNIFIKS